MRSVDKGMPGLIRLLHMRGAGAGDVVLVGHHVSLGSLLCILWVGRVKDLPVHPDFHTGIGSAGCFERGRDGPPSDGEC